MSNVSKGNYYKKKTKDYFKDLGYMCESIEMQQRLYTPRGLIFVKKDLFFSDLLAINDERIIFIQCKLNKKNIADAFKKYSEFKTPFGVEKWIMVWTPRCKDPEIIEVV